MSAEVDIAAVLPLGLCCRVVVLLPGDLLKLWCGCCTMISGLSCCWDAVVPGGGRFPSSPWEFRVFLPGGLSQ